MEGKQRIADQSASDQKRQDNAAMAMADLEIMKAQGAKSVADQNPEVKKVALLFLAILGITLFSQISSYLVVRSFDNTHTSFFSAFVGSNGTLGITLLLIQVIAIFVLLFTRNISRAKIIILVAGVGYGISLVNSFSGFQIDPAAMAKITTIAVNLLILRKIFKVYLDL